MLYGDLAEAGSELPPQGLCLLAGILRQRGWEPTIVDAKPLGLTVEETVEQILLSDPDYVGFSVYTVFAQVVADICQKLKEARRAEGRDITTIVGGAHVTFLAEDYMAKHPELDIGVVGEGEDTLPELLECLERGGSLKEVSGLVYRWGGRTVRTARRASLPDLDGLPLPAWDLLPRLDRLYRPAPDSIKRTPATGIVVSRGCPSKCYFCNPRGLGTSFRIHSPAYIISMIRELQRTYGINDIYIMDDMFTAEREFVLDFCRELKASGLDITWSCQARTDSVDPELLQAMKGAGCWQVGFGLESGSQKVLELINKGSTVEQNAQALAWCREVGLEVKGLFMIGSFGETKEDVELTIEFIRNNYLTDLHVTFFTPMPGTGSWKMWPDWGDFDPEEAEGCLHRPSFIGHGWTEEELVAFQKRCYRVFYLRPTVVWRYARKLTRPSQAGKVLRSALGFFRYTLLSFNGRLGAAPKGGSGRPSTSEPIREMELSNVVS